MHSCPLLSKTPKEVPFGAKNPKEGVMLQFGAKIQKGEESKMGTSKVVHNIIKAFGLIL